MKEIVLVIVVAAMAMLPMYLLADNINDDEYTKTALGGVLVGATAVLWKLVNSFRKPKTGA